MIRTDNSSSYFLLGNWPIKLKITNERKIWYGDHWWSRPGSKRQRGNLWQYAIFNDEECQNHWNILWLFWMSLMNKICKYRPTFRKLSIVLDLLNLFPNSNLFWTVQVQKDKLVYREATGKCVNPFLTFNFSYRWSKYNLLTQLS